MYGEMEVQLQALLTSALNRGEWSVLLSGAAVVGNRTMDPQLPDEFIPYHTILFVEDPF